MIIKSLYITVELEFLTRWIFCVKQKRERNSVIRLYSSSKINSGEAVPIICNFGTVAPQYFFRVICIRANEIRDRVLHLYLSRINIQSGPFVTFVEIASEFLVSRRMVYDRTRGASEVRAMVGQVKLNRFTEGSNWNVDSRFTPVVAPSPSATVRREKLW